MSNPLVAIRCITYNQKAYVKQCFDSFLMQKADFPFVVIVHDDASTDGTVDIINEYVKEYPDIFIPILEKENQYQKVGGLLTRTMLDPAPESVKYIALCEGDDYWIDPLKLQKQVDFLEGHEEVSLVFTDCRRLLKNGEYETTDKMVHTPPIKSLIYNILEK